MSHLRLLRKRTHSKAENGVFWKGKYKAAFFKQYEVKQDDNLYKDFRQDFMRLPEVVHRHILEVLSVSDRIAMEQTCSYFHYISRATPWTIKKCEITEESQIFHIKLDDICHRLEYSIHKRDEMIKSIHCFMRNVRVFEKFKYCKPILNDAESYIIIETFLPYIYNVQEIELQSIKVSVNFLNGFLKNLSKCKSYAFKDVKFNKKTKIEEIWPLFTQMEKLTLHNITNLVYENTVFNLLKNRIEPIRPLKSVSFLLKNKGIDPQQIFNFSRRLQEFDRTQMAKIRIMFPSEWKKRERVGSNRDKLYNLLTDNYDEFCKDRVLVSILMIKDDEFHTASNGNLFYGKYPLF